MSGKIKEYSVEFLAQMHQATPAVVAVDGLGCVVGYALAVDQSLALGHSLLSELCRTIQDQVVHSTDPSSFVMVGQLCIAREWRGKGLVSQLYQHFRHIYAPAFQRCITDLSEWNLRSLRAHEKVGFTVVHSFSGADATTSGQTWHIICWDWRAGSD
ncbi:hypothetical protein HDU91_007083 [Kappamyces sp. JEL0680]|nr:hypothetical protein HDU91_007083 [Kappamyces sp. JEL0680]